MIALGLLVSLAWGAPTGGDLRAWSTTAVEALPDAYGKSGARALERLGLDVAFEDGWGVSLDGALRLLRAPGAPIEGNLYRLAAAHQGEIHRLTLGRHVHLDARGFQRIDGASVDLDVSRAFGASMWAGRQWHAEVWDATEAIVVGGQVRLSTGDRMRARSRLDLGAEVRVIDGLFRPRGHLASTIVWARGARMLAFAEVGADVEPGEVETRASLDVSGPVGRTVDLGAEVRWEDMSPDHAGVVRTPMDWLATDGYSLAGGRFRWFDGPWDLVAQAGGTIASGDQYGGVARLGLGLSRGDVRTGIFGTTAGMGGSWLAGGGGEVAWSPDFLRARADIGVYGFQGIDGVATEVWEGRVEARIPVYRSDREGLASELAIGVEGAAGTDRQLATWMRGGLAFHATVARGGSR